MSLWLAVWLVGGRSLCCLLDDVQRQCGLIILHASATKPHHQTPPSTIETPNPKGTGGIRCFACEGLGEMENLIKKDAPTKPPKRDPVGRSGGNPRACRVCGGGGLCLCSRCRGSGYINPGI
jgi:hypothetical protein